WASSGGVRQYQNRCRSEESSDLFFAYVTLELDARTIAPALTQRFDIPGTHGMIGARDHQFRLGKPVRDLCESFNQNFGTLVRPPLPECEDSMLGISAFAHVRELGRCGENAVLA